MADGVREEQEHFRAGYEEYLATISRYEFVDTIVTHRKHVHQAEMTRITLEDEATVETPLILFVEHDAPLVGDIDFDSCADAIRTGQADLIRLHHEATIPEPHWHLMPDGNHPYWVNGVRLLRTLQWSQRPHLASTDYYRRILKEHFTPGEPTFIEDRMHGIVQSNPWEDHKLWIYYPMGNIKRSTHLDSRGSEPKWIDS